MRIWTRAYNPFVMGGSVHQPVATDVAVEGPYDLGKGIQVYATIAPNGTTIIIEAQSGGIVGNSLDTVAEDLRSADPEELQKQIIEQTKIGKTAKLLSAAEFWKLMRVG